MPKIDLNAPAFPVAGGVSEDGHRIEASPGLSIHQEFAKAAMQGIVFRGYKCAHNRAMQDAVAMIAALNEEPSR